MTSAPSLAAELERGFQGPLLEPGNADYEDARRLWNGQIDRRPALIARCLSDDDVSAAVAYGRDKGLLLAVRGGGHNVSGNAVCDGGLVVDLSLMRRVQVDESRRVAKVQSGALLRDVDAATLSHGLAAPVGINSTTGIAGLTLGGGIGHLSRKHGLTIDSLANVDLVTAAGERIRANNDENPDLFWGLRGGGGNFGVATSFTLRLHTLRTKVLCGLIVYSAERATEILRLYRDFVADAPEHLGSMVSLRKAPATPFMPRALHGKQVAGIVICWTGEPDEGEKALRPFRDLRPDAYLVKVQPYAEFQSAFDATAPPGWSYYSKSHYLRPMTDSAIDVVASWPWRARSTRSFTLIGHLGGALARVADDETAFAGRDASHVININGAWTSGGADTAEDTAWVRAFFEAMQPHSTGGVYVNFLGNEGQDRIRAAYGNAKYERLRKLKGRWDPQNVFRMNQNIVPTG